MRDEFIPYDRIRAIQEELAGFFLDQVIHEKGEYHTEIQWEFGALISGMLYCIYVVASDRYTKTYCSTNLGEREVTSLCICS